MTQLPIFRVHYRRLEEHLAKVYRTGGFDFLLAAKTCLAWCRNVRSARCYRPPNTPGCGPMRAMPAGKPATRRERGLRNANVGRHNWQADADRELTVACTSDHFAAEGGDDAVNESQSEPYMKACVLPG